MKNPGDYRTCVLLAQWITWLTRAIVAQRCQVQSPLAARTFLEQESLITSLSFNRGLTWFNRGLKRMCKVKRRRFKRAKKSRDWERYVAHKKATALALKAARWDHLNGILQTSLEEKNTKPFHRYIKAQKNDNFGISSLKFNGLMYSDSSSKSEILNKQFQSVFTKKKHHSYS